MAFRRRRRTRRRFRGRKRRRTFRRRRTRRSRMARRGTMVVPRLILPTMTIVKLPASLIVTFPIVALVGIADFQIRANDIFNPFVGTSTRSVKGHDQYALLYRSYTVLSSRMSVQWTAQGGILPGDTHFNVFGILEPTHETTEWQGLGAPSKVETPGTVWRVLQNNTSNPRSTAKWRSSYNTRSFFKQNPLQENDFETVFGNSPTRFAVWDMQIRSPTPAVAVGGFVSVHIKVVYTCALRHRDVLAAS